MGSMIKYVEFAGFTDTGVREFGRIVLERGKLRAEGGALMEKLLNERVRDLTPKGDQSWLTREDGERFLRALPYVYHGGYLCASRVRTKK